MYLPKGWDPIPPFRPSPSPPPHTHHLTTKSRCQGNLDPLSSPDAAAAAVGSQHSPTQPLSARLQALSQPHRRSLDAAAASLGDTPVFARAHAHGTHFTGPWPCGALGRLYPPDSPASPRRPSVPAASPRSPHPPSPLVASPPQPVAAGQYAGLDMYAGPDAAAGAGARPGGAGVGRGAGGGSIGIQLGQRPDGAFVIEALAPGGPAAESGKIQV